MPTIKKPNLKQQAMAQLRLDGWPYVENVEHWMAPRPGSPRVDLGGIADIMAVGETGNMLLVQVTSGGGHGDKGTNHAARVRKILESQFAALFLECLHHRIEVWSWDQPGVWRRVAITSKPVQATRPTQKATDGS